MKFRYIGKFPMWIEINGSSKLLNSGDVIDSSTQLIEGFEPVVEAAPITETPNEAPKIRKKRKSVDASDTDTSSVW